MSPGQVKAIPDNCYRWEKILSPHRRQVPHGQGGGGDPVLSTRFHLQRKRHQTVGADRERGASHDGRSLGQVDSGDAQKQETESSVQHQQRHRTHEEHCLQVQRGHFLRQSKTVTNKF